MERSGHKNKNVEVNCKHIIISTLHTLLVEPQMFCVDIGAQRSSIGRNQLRRILHEHGKEPSRAITPISNSVSVMYQSSHSGRLKYIRKIPTKFPIYQSYLMSLLYIWKRCKVSTHLLDTASFQTIS